MNYPDWMKRHPAPWAMLLPADVILALATFGPVGRLRRAPGTWGSLAGLALFTILMARSSPVGFILLEALLLYVAVSVSHEAERRLMKRDPGEIVIDEALAMPLCFTGLQPYLFQPYSWLLMLTAFGLFRFFDIVKPFGIARLQKLPGGWGVVADDVAAALATAVVLNLAMVMLPFRLG